MILKEKRSMLVVLAHPDDESFGMAGTIARYVSEGVEVSLICTTNGDVGTVDPEHMEGYSTIAEKRLAELKCATDILSVANVITFGYRDSGMAGTPENKHPDCLAAADIDEVAGRIAQVIRELKPQIVVTFDPYGGYGHPDHIVTHLATVQAFESTTRQELQLGQPEDGTSSYQAQKLYFMTFDRRFLKLVIDIMSLVRIFGDPRHMGRNKDVDAYEIAAHSYPIHASIDTAKYRDVADMARRCHASQLGGIGPRRMSQIISAVVFGIQEHYMRYFPPVANNLRERDLFEGVSPD